MSDASVPNRANILRTRHGTLVGLMTVLGLSMLLTTHRADLITPPAYELQVNANTASSGVLEALPRIGPTLASRIVEERTRRPFTALDDLDSRVKGIGPATRNGIARYLFFTTEPDVSAR